MAFPSPASNGQLYVSNGTTYIYLSQYDLWQKYSVTTTTSSLSTNNATIASASITTSFTSNTATVNNAIISTSSTDTAIINTANVGNINVTGLASFANISLSSIYANGSYGTAGQVLTSNGTKVYWNSVVGYVGSKGDSGLAGYNGSQGDSGYNGSVGYTGSRGITGFTGSQGVKFQGEWSIVNNYLLNDVVNYSGALYIAIQNIPFNTISIDNTAYWNILLPSAYTGSKGYNGSQGISGFNGSKGDIGFTGSKGDIGFVGSKGDIGYSGSLGDVGFTGSIGDTGYNGSSGFQGSKGDTGYIGSTIYISRIMEC